MTTAKQEAEKRWEIHGGGVTDTRDVPHRLEQRAAFEAGAEWAYADAADAIEFGAWPGAQPTVPDILRMLRRKQFGG